MRCRSRLPTPVCASRFRSRRCTPSWRADSRTWSRRATRTSKSWSDDVHRAETLGIALQLINIIRDVREDWELGRVYLPQDELASFGVVEEDIAAGAATSTWRALMTFQAERARSFLRDGLGLLTTLDGRSALCVSTFAGLYRATLERIEARDFDVFAGPPHLSALTKLRIVGGGLRR